VLAKFSLSVLMLKERRRTKKEFICSLEMLAFHYLVRLDEFHGSMQAVTHSDAQFPP
jgi:hypothetical protein